MLPVSKQPFKALFLLYQLTSTATLRLPVWILLSILSRRPRPSWGIVRTALTQLVRHYIRVTEYTGRLGSNYNHLNVDRHAGGIWVDPAPLTLINDELHALSAASQTKPARVPGYWTPALDDSEIRGHILYSLHGGGYIDGSAHPSAPFATITSGIVKHRPSITHVFSLEYRLSTETEHAFPTALLDALSGYYYLVHTLHIAPSAIIIEGDSAGGNLALALTRYLTRSGVLPVPAGLLLHSPWVDIGTSHDFPIPFLDTSSFKLYADYDPEPHGVDRAKNAYLGPNGYGSAELNPYISPGSQNAAMNDISFTGFPPTFICYGGAENLASQIRLLKLRMEKYIKKLEVHEAADASHDYLLFSWQEPERTDTLNAISLWVQSLE